MKKIMEKMYWSQPKDMSEEEWEKSGLPTTEPTELEPEKFDLETFYKPFQPIALSYQDGGAVTREPVIHPYIESQEISEEEYSEILKGDGVYNLPDNFYRQPWLDDEY